MVIGASNSIVNHYSYMIHRMRHRVITVDENAENNNEALKR